MTPNPCGRQLNTHIRYIHCGYILSKAPFRANQKAFDVKLSEFHILLVLTNKRLHGLGIAKAVDEATEGSVKLGPGTLYRSLKELALEGLVEHATAPPGQDDPRRRFYRISPAGLTRVKGEAGRLARLVEVARTNNLLPESS